MPDLSAANEHVRQGSECLRLARGQASIGSDPSENARRAARSFRHAADELDPPPPAPRGDDLPDDLRELLSRVGYRVDDETRGELEAAILRELGRQDPAAAVRRILG